MTAIYTFDVFMSLDGYGSAGSAGDWGGYWGKQGPELAGASPRVVRRRAADGLRRQHVQGLRQMLAESTEGSDVRDPWVTRMRNLPTTVVSSTLDGELDWPDAHVASGDAVEVVARLKEESDVPLRSRTAASR